MDWKDSLKYPLVYVEWGDPTSIDKWSDISTIEHEGDKIKTCGFLIHNKESCLVLALNVDEEEDSASCIMIIPKSLIIRQFEVFSK